MKKLTILLVLLTAFSTVTLSRWVNHDASQLPVSERTIKDDLLPDAPIAITAVRNLQGDEWWKNFELEVKNVGDKPIYYLKFGLIYSEVFRPGTNTHLGVPLKYGRSEVFPLSSVPTKDDIPIKPGESHIFKIHEGLWAGLKDINSRTDVPSDAFNHLELKFTFLRFGDGTGLEGGKPVKLQSAQNHSQAIGNQKRKTGSIKMNHAPLKGLALVCDCQCSLVTFQDGHYCSGCAVETTTALGSPSCDDPERRCSDTDHFDWECHWGPNPEDFYYCEDWFGFPC